MQATAITTERVIDTLEEVSRLHAVRRDADAALFELAATFADQHAGDALVPATSSLPGGERSVQVGGAGTPRVAEFAYAELGARMQMSPVSARRLVADALDVRHRLPLIWSRVIAREARVSNARLVATRTRHLSTEAAAYVDRAMADHVDGSLPWGRFETRLAGKVVAADPEVAAEREAARVAEQFAKRTRSSEEGTAGFYVRSTVGVIARLDATITFLADALKAFGDGDVEDLRRVKAVAVLANPVRAVELLAAFAALRSDSVSVGGVGSGLDKLDQPEGLLDQPDGALARMEAFARRVGFTPRRLPDWLAARAPDEHRDPPDHRPAFEFDWSRLLPSLTMYLHFSADDLARGEGGVVRWEGEGPVTHAFVHDHLRPLHRYVIKPVIDLARQAPVDAYEVPDRLRRGGAPGGAVGRVPVRGRSEPRARRGPHRRLRPVARRPATEAVVDAAREPRAAGALPPPDQDPREVGAAPALHGDLPVARPARRRLPGGPHRHPRDRPRGHSLQRQRL